VQGYSVRTLDYRFTEWYKFNGEKCVAELDAIHATELYNHTGHVDPGDFDNWENENLASTAPPALVESLRQKIKARFSRVSNGCPPDQPEVSD
jgi:hypothetical protein